MGLAVLQGVGAKPSTLITKSITANGTYNASSDSADGYSQVTVNVPPTLFRKLVDRSITTVTADDLAGVTEIGGCAFYSSRISSITIPNTVRSIGTTCFRYCTSLANINIPDSVETIAGNCFRDCPYLTIVTIGTGITSIGDGAFRDDSYLEVLTIKATTPPTLSTVNSLSGTNPNLVIYVPAGSVNAYKTATNWSSYASRIQAIT